METNTINPLIIILAFLCIGGMVIGGGAIGLIALIRYNARKHNPVAQVTTAIQRRSRGDHDPVPESVQLLNAQNKWTFRKLVFTFFGGIFSLMFLIALALLFSGPGVIADFVIIVFGALGAWVANKLKTA